MNSSTLRLVLATGLALGSLAACGGNDTDDEGSAAPRASASVEATLTAAEAEAIAKASVLVAADLPGYEATPADETPDPDEEKAQAELEKCIGVNAPDYLAEASSDDFSKGEPPAGIEVTSEVSVVKTEAEGKADLEAFLSDKALSCFDDFVGTALKAAESSGVTVKSSDVERFDVTKPAEASEAFGLRVKGGLAAGPAEFDFSIEIVGALVDRAELSVITFAFGEGLTPQEQSALLAKMATRAQAAQA